MIDKDIELKDCPFCGAMAELKELSGRWAALCTKQCAGTKIFNDKNRAVEDWNRRVENKE